MSDRKAILQQLISLSRELGRPASDLVILAEGNTSARVSSDTFMVKASGANLASIDESGLVECRFEPLLKLLEGPAASDAAVEAVLMDCRVDSNAKKPSVEAVFHAQLLSLPGVNFVGHTHPVTVNGILCTDLVKKFAEERRFPDEIVCCGETSVVVPYVDPGVALAREIAAASRKFVDANGQSPRIILLANHGLIAPAGTTQGVLAATLMAEKAARIFAVSQSLGNSTALTTDNVLRISRRPDEHYRRAQLKI